MSTWSGMREFTVELPTGQQVTGEVHITFVHDSNYGADADGNRGIAMDFIEDLYVETVLQTDDEGVALTEAQVKAAEVMLCEQAESHDWSDQMDGPEPDYEPDFDDEGKADCNCSDCCHDCPSKE